MKQRSIITLILLVVVVLGMALIGQSPIRKNLRLGLDIRGGVHVSYQAVKSSGGTVSDEDMNQLVEVMRRRVDEMGVAEPVIQREGNDRVIIELAGIQDPDQAVEIIGRTAMLEFKTPDGQVILTGKDLRDAKASRDPASNEPEVNLSFNAEGTKKFSDVTSRLVQQYPEVGGKQDSRRTIAIYLDEQLLTNPYVKDVIRDGEARISGSYTMDEAVNTAALLRGGALPVNVSLLEKRTVGPSLGRDSLERSQLAVMAGLTAILLFMLLYYRVSGLVANFSLVVYALIVMGILVGLKAAISLPGIAGLLLSVGMAVDANVIIYERFKEEVRNGKTLRAGLEAGFRRAFWTIFDSNLTTLIAAFLLFYFGTGTVRGFAVTLSLGILTSMFTALTFTHYVMRLIITSGLFKNKKLFGI